MTRFKKLSLLILVLAILGLSFWFLRSESSLESSLEANLSGEGMLVPASPAQILALIKSNEDKATLVNVWASWCGPCIEELPLLVKLRQEYKDKGFKLILYSADKTSDREAALQFLEMQKVDFTNYFKGDISIEEIEVLFPGWEGVLPISILFNDQGEILQKWMGTAPYEEFKTVVEKALNN